MEIFDSTQHDTSVEVRQPKIQHNARKGVALHKREAGTAIVRDGTIYPSYGEPLGEGVGESAFIVYEEY